LVIEVRGRKRRIKGTGYLIVVQIKYPVPLIRPTVSANRPESRR